MQHVPEPTKEFPYVGVNPKTGTWVRSCRPLYQETWTDVPVLHLFWSYGYTLRRICKAYLLLSKDVWYRLTNPRRKD